MLEAGPRRAPPTVTTVDALAALGEPGWLWPDVVAEQRLGSHRSTSEYRQGRGLGGGTAVNSLVLAPGERSDYDAWERDAGCDGWGWSAMEPWFAAVANMLRPQIAASGPFADALGAVAVDAGHPDGGSSAAIDAVGYLAAGLAADLSSGRRRRCSAADAYLAPAADGSPRPLTIRAETAVVRVELDRGRATGVELADGTIIRAGLVVLSAGALATPHLLWRSGLRHPSLGRAVSDHPSFVFTVSLRPGARISPAVDHPPVTAMLRWSSGSPTTRSVSDLSAHVLDHVGRGPEGRRYGAVIVMLGDVRSRGRLELRDGVGGGSNHPPVGSELRFSPGWLADPDDRARLLTGVRHVASLLADGALHRVIDGVAIDDRGTPLAALDEMSDADAERWLIDHPGPVSHVAATLPLQPSPGDSGGTSHRVSGLGSLIGRAGSVAEIEGLHAIDASVLPALPTGNPQLPVMAVAERLSSELVR